MAASNAVVGALSVIIGGDASSLDKMLKGAESSLSGFAKRVASIAGGVGLVDAVKGAASAMVDMVQKGLSDVAELGKMADATGVSIEQLSRLKYSADLAGIASDTLKSSIQTLSHAIADLGSDNVTPATRALEAMDISARNADGTMKTSTQVLAEVADKFASYKDGVNKAKLAQDLFGVGGEAMIPLLNRGAQGMSELGAEADRFGLTLDGETKAQVASFNLSLTKMDAIKKGVVTTIVSKLAPALASISAAMLGVREKSDLVGRVAEWVGDRMKYLTVVGLTVVTVFDRVTATWGDLFRVAGFIAKGDFSSAWGVITASAGKSAESAKALKTAVDDVFSGVKKGAPEAGKAITDGLDAPTSKAVSSVKNALELYLDSSAKRTAAVEAEAATIGKSAAEQARLRVEYEATAVAQAKGIALTDEYRARIAAAGDAAAAAALKVAGANARQDAMSPEERRNQQLQRYIELLNAGQLTMEQFSLVSQKVEFPNFTNAAIAAADLQMQFDQLATSAVNGLGSAFAQVISGSKSAGEAFGQFAVQFIVQMIEMIAKAVIFKLIMAAIGFSGGGEVGVMQVGDQFFPQLAGGGPIFGPGTGTSDSIPAMLSNGEFVVNAAATKRFEPVLAAINDNRIPGYAGGGMVGSAGTGGMGAAAAPATIDVAGLGRDSYSREEVIKIIEGINSAIADNYHINVKAA